MAKDGTHRGGARPGAGRKPKPLADKLKEQKKVTAMTVPPELQGIEMPSIREYLVEEQRDGSKLCSEEVYNETYKWLKEMKCDAFVPKQLVEQYAMTVGRWIHCEQTISKLCYIAKHPTTGAAISSPYVKMSMDYSRQATILMNEITQIVKENCPQEVVNNPNDDVMEILLRARKG